MEKAEFEHTTFNAGIIGLTALAGAVIGFVLQLLIAYFFGAGQATDAFFMALSSSELLSKVLLGGSIVSVFIPLFIEETTKKDRASAWHLALIVIHVIALAYLALLVVVGLQAPAFIRLIAPGFSPDLAHTTVQLLRIMLPAFFCLFIVELGTAILQAVKHFVIPATLRLVAPTVSIISILALASTLGIYALAVGVLIGSFAQLTLIGYALYRQGFTYHFVWQPTSPVMRKLWLLVSPFIVSMVITQVAGIAYRVLVSDLPIGSLSALKFAEKITQLLTVMFLTSVTTVMYPVLAERASRHGAPAILPALASASRLIFFVSIPLVVTLTLLRTPLIQVLFERGSFTPDNTTATSIALLFLSLGLLTNGISALFGYATLALQKTKAAVVITALSQGVAIALFLLLTPAMGHAGLALASSLVPIAITIMYVTYLARFIPDILTAFWHRTYLISLVLGGVMTIVTFFAYAAIEQQNIPGIIGSLTEFILPAIIGNLIYIGGAWILQISEVRTLATLVSEKLSRVKSII